VLCAHVCAFLFLLKTVDLAVVGEDISLTAPTSQIKDRDLVQVLKQALLLEKRFIRTSEIYFLYRLISVADTINKK
jgi:hypothetical protein